MIGTHNSLSFCKPQWWLRPFCWMAKCQSLTIKEQWDKGARYFDIRIKYTKDGVVSGHGIMTYNIDVAEQLAILNLFAKESRNVCYIRMVIENNKDVEYLKEFYKICSKVFVNLRFLGLVTKNPWVYIVENNYSIPEIHGYKMLKWYNFLCPKYWAYKYIEKNRKVNHNNKYFILDFIELYTK